MDADRGLIRRSVRDLEGYVPGEQPDDPSILKLNTNENPYPPSPAVTEALAALEAGRLRLYPDPVCAELRRELAGLHGCHPAQILVGNGSDELLALCLRAFVERDAQVGWFEPSYSLYPVLTAIEDLAACPVALNDTFGWVDPDPESTDLFFVTNPNAPTGLLFDRERVEAFCSAARGVVVIDEAYVDFAEADCVDLALTRPNVLVTRTLSKSYALAGIRLGYILGPASLIEALYKIKDSYNVNALSQALALAAVRDQESFRDTVARVRRTRARTAEALRAMGWSVGDSQANFLWARPPDGDAAGRYAALRDAGILVRYFPGPKTGPYLRVSVGADDEMDHFLAACAPS